MSGKRENDVKAPDGFLLGGERRVRKGGVVLFQRGWWQLPEGFAEQGEYVQVHCTEGGAGPLEVAPPGYNSFPHAVCDGKTVLCPRTDRGDAKPGYRTKAHRAWRGA